MSQALLLSGGHDSLALAYWHRPAMALTINYGQLSASAEIRASRSICEILGIRHAVLAVDCSAIGSGDMAGLPADSLASKSDWWPFRNQLLITLAAMWAIREQVSEIMIGTVSPDGVHADGRPEFVELLRETLACQEGAVGLSAPGIAMTSIELLEKVKLPFNMLPLAYSCHKGNMPCNNCRGCNKKRKIFEYFKSRMSSHCES